MRVIRTERGVHFSRGSQLFAEALDARELTMTAAADAIGVHKSQVSSWLNGDRRPGLEAAIKIRDLYGVPVEAWHQAPAVAAESGPALPADAVTGTHS